MVARLLWEQDAAGSNPVSPMRSETSPQLVSEPSLKGRFFIADELLRAKRAYSHLIAILFAHDFSAPLTVGRQKTRCIQQWPTNFFSFEAIF